MSTISTGSDSLMAIRALVACDSFACTFQTFGQYRSALLREIDAEIAAAESAADTRETANG